MPILPFIFLNKAGSLVQRRNSCTNKHWRPFFSSECSDTSQWLFVSKEQSQKPWLTFPVSTYTRPAYYVRTTTQHPLCAERVLSNVKKQRQERTVGKISARKICNLWNKRDNKSIPSTCKIAIVNCRNNATISYLHNKCTGRRVRVACSVELHHTGMEMSHCVKAICSLMAKWLTRLRWYTGNFAFHQGTHRGQSSFGNRWTIIHWPSVWRLHKFLCGRALLFHNRPGLRNSCTIAHGSRYWHLACLAKD